MLVAALQVADLNAYQHAIEENIGSLVSGMRCLSNKEKNGEFQEPAIKYHLIKTEKHTGARLGEIETHGTFHADFMPVGTQATVRPFLPEEHRC